ncbi:hypothetical protein V6N11_051744 [Hibiscus sabdariffa]|uniref:Uncharacterized protein n=1 Tax=Hibiscus sabdariffa TaxID=183260 RepID=A0ABR2U899_9ROSI
MPASAGISTGNMLDSAQICRGRFTNSAPADAIIAALAGSKCHQPGTASDDKGDVSNRDNESCQGRYLGGHSDLGRTSRCVIGLSLSPNN